MCTRHRKRDLKDHYTFKEDCLRPSAGRAVCVLLIGDM